MIVLVADELGPLPETIRSRCQRDPVPAALGAGRARGGRSARAPQLSRRRGDLDRPGRRRPARPRRAPARPAGREAPGGAARDRARRLRDPEFDPRRRGAERLEAARERAAEAKEREEAALEGLDLTAREAEQRVKRAARGAEREELLAVARGARGLVPRPRRRGGRRREGARPRRPRRGARARTATLERLEGAERAAELVRETWRRLEEFQLSPRLALEALFIELRRAFAGALVGNR